MKKSVPNHFHASATEQASIRALKNWLLAAPPQNALDDQIVRERLSSAIAILSESQAPLRQPKPNARRSRAPAP